MSGSGSLKKLPPQIHKDKSGVKVPEKKHKCNCGKKSGQQDSAKPYQK